MARQAMGRRRERRRRKSCRASRRFKMMKSCCALYSYRGRAAQERDQASYTCSVQMPDQSLQQGIHSASPSLFLSPLLCLKPSLAPPQLSQALPHPDLSSPTMRSRALTPFRKSQLWQSCREFDEKVSNGDFGRWRRNDDGFDILGTFESRE